MPQIAETQTAFVNNRLSYPVRPPITTRQQMDDPLPLRIGKFEPTDHDEDSRSANLESHEMYGRPVRKGDRRPTLVSLH